MSLTNTKHSYGSVAKFFHWTTSIIVITMLIVGLTMHDMEKPMKFTVYMMHKSTGLFILFFVLLRLLWSISNPKPQSPPNVHLWEKVLAKLTHGTLYSLLLFLPLSGWIMSTAANKIPSFYGMFKMPLPFVQQSKDIASFFHGAHEFFAWALITLLTIHILAAIKHHFIDKDNVLTRMLPGK